jgi:hypothetical protein
MERQSHMSSLCVWARLGVSMEMAVGVIRGESGSGFVNCCAGQDGVELWEEGTSQAVQNNAGSRINMQLSPPLAPAAQRHSSPLLLFCLTKSLHHRPSTTTRSLPVA